jgi:hypothetical protein
MFSANCSQPAQDCLECPVISEAADQKALDDPYKICRQNAGCAGHPPVFFQVMTLGGRISVFGSLRTKSLTDESLIATCPRPDLSRQFGSSD